MEVTELGMPEHLRAVTPAVAHCKTAAGAVPVEQDVAVVHILEFAASRACVGRHGHPSCGNSRRKGEGELGHRQRDVGVWYVYSGERYRDGVGLVLDEVVAVDGYSLSRFCPLVGHRVDCGCGREDLERVSDGVFLGAPYQIHLVGVDHRKACRDTYDEGVVRDVARIEGCFLVAEPDLTDTLEVVADDAEQLVHICLLDEDILVGIADETH